MEAWIKIFQSWKGGRRWFMSIKVNLFEYNPKNGYYRCFGYRPYSGMNTCSKQIKHVSKNNIIKKVG